MRLYLYKYNNNDIYKLSLYNFIGIENVEIRELLLYFRMMTLIGLFILVTENYFKLNLLRY